MSWYLDGPEDLSVKVFLKEYSAILEKILHNPDASVMITDRPGCAIQIARYLKKHDYQNCVIYHTGSKPRHKIGSFSTVGGFSSLEECRRKMKENCQHYFEYKP